MRRDQLEHAIRTSCQIIDAAEVIVVGSQAILGTYGEDELPAAATMSAEVDVLPIASTDVETERLADAIEGVAGEFSPFEQAHGYSIDGVDLTTSALPDGWRGRLVRVQNANTAAPSGEPPVHRLVRRQGRPLRRQALRSPREGPELRRRAARRKPGRCGRHLGTTCHRPNTVQAERRSRAGVARRLAQALVSHRVAGEATSTDDSNAPPPGPPRTFPIVGRTKVPPRRRQRAREPGRQLEQP